MPPAFLIGGNIESSLSVRSVLTSHPVCTKNGFQAMSFEYIGVLDSYFIHGYIIINTDQVGLRIKSTDYYQSYAP